jgi:predicted RecA/RadA family phage recombinase
MKNFIQAGGVITAAVAVAAVSGDLVILGALAAVASGNYAVNETGEYALEGVYELPALNTSTATIGSIAYWDQTNKRVTDAASGNVAIGHFFVAKVNGETVAKVRLAQRLA